jgi:hypothetical protein
MREVNGCLIGCFTFSLIWLVAAIVLTCIKSTWDIGMTLLWLLPLDIVVGLFFFEKEWRH